MLADVRCYFLYKIPIPTSNTNSTITENKKKIIF